MSGAVLVSPRRFRPWRPCRLLLSATGCAWFLSILHPLAAADCLVQDVGVGVASLPTVYDYRLVPRSGPDLEGRDSFDRSFALLISVREAATDDSWGPVGGCDVSSRRAWSTGVVFETVEVAGCLGWGWRPHPACLVVGEGLIGLGWGRLHIDGPGLDRTGSLLVTGVQMAVRWAISGHWSLMGAAGWRTMEGTFHGDRDDIALRQSGPCYAGGVTWGW